MPVPTLASLTATSTTNTLPSHHCLTKQAKIMSSPSAAQSAAQLRANCAGLPPYIPVEERWERNRLILESEERERERAALSQGPSLHEIERAKLKVLNGGSRVRFFGGYRERDASAEP